MQALYLSPGVAELSRHGVRSFEALADQLCMTSRQSPNDE